MKRVPADLLLDDSSSVLKQTGFTDEQAAQTAELLVDASLRGIDSHGVIALLPYFVLEVARGVVRPGAEAVYVECSGATATIDGQHGPGVPALTFARSFAESAAKRYGVGAAVVRNCGYLGPVGLLIRPTAVVGLIGVLSCNGEPCVAPYGGCEALHGTNPLAVAVPTRSTPLLLDMRTNALRTADYLASVAGDGELPAGSLLDARGRPSRDPADVASGVLLPLAGAKGYGLALMIDILTAALAGGPIGQEVRADRPAEYSALALALDPGKFGPHEGFLDAVARLSEQARAIRPQDPARPVRLPGDRSESQRSARLRDGIPIERARWEEFVAELGALGVSLPSATRCEP